MKKMIHATEFLARDIEESEMSRIRYEDRIETVGRMRRLGIPDSEIETLLGITIPAEEAAQ